MSLLKNCSNYWMCYKNFLNSLKSSTILCQDIHISRNCNNHLLQKTVHLEKNVVTNCQYHRRETLGKNPVPESLGDEILEEHVRKALSLIGVNATPE